MKLYLVTLKGFAGTTNSSNYVVAKDPTSAYEKVKADLDKRDYGFRKDRELDSIKLLAEANEYTDAQSMLYL